MPGETRYLIIGTPKFQQDLHFLRRQAHAASGSWLSLYREALREIERLRTGASNGHHPLTYEPGKGDLRDCVTAHVRSDPQRRADYRLVFREHAPETPGGPPRRELLAIKPRRGTNNIYTHVCARLHRQLTDPQPGLNHFNTPDLSRQASLDTKRALAHTLTGHHPLRSSRPLTPAAPPAPRPPTQAPASARRGPTGWPAR